MRQFTEPELVDGIRKLRRRIAQVQGLDPEAISFDDARVHTVESNVHVTIREVFGSNSPEFDEHQYTTSGTVVST